MGNCTHARHEENQGRQRYYLAIAQDGQRKEITRDGGGCQEKGARVEALKKVNFTTKERYKDVKSIKANILGI